MVRDCRSSNQGNDRSFAVQAHNGNIHTNNLNFFEDDDGDDFDKTANVACAFAISVAVNYCNDGSGSSIYDWVVDSGASRHMCGNKSLFNNLRVSNVKNILVANKNKLHASGEGEEYLESVDDKQITLKNVLYVPHIAANLLSVGWITDRNGSVIFKKNKCFVKVKNDKVVSVATKNDQGIYVLNNNNSKMISYCSKTTNAVQSDNIKKVNPADINLCHRRLGHLNEAYIRCLAKGAAKGINLRPNQQLSECVPRIQGKMCKKSFKPSSSRAKARLELIHTDLGQMDVL